MFSHHLDPKRAKGDENDSPPQTHHAKRGFACHSILDSKAYVFTSHPKR